MITRVIKHSLQRAGELLAAAGDAFYAGAGRTFDTYFETLDHILSRGERLIRTPLGMLLGLPLMFGAVVMTAVLVILTAAAFMVFCCVLVGAALFAYALPFIALERSVLRDLASSPEQSQLIAAFLTVAVPAAVLAGLWLRWAWRYYTRPRRIEA